MHVYSSLLFNMCTYHFVLEPSTKTEILNVENEVSHRRNAIPTDIMQVRVCVCFCVSVITVASGASVFVGECVCFLYAC